MNIEPLPFNYPINVDFLPELGLQTYWDKDRRLFKMTLNVGAVLGSETERTKYGDLTIIDRNTTQRHTTLEVGCNNPEDFEITQKEVYNQIMDATGGVDRITIKERGMIHKIPEELRDNPAFETAECLYHSESAKGNYPHMMRERTAYPITNINEMIKNELMERISKSYSLRRMKININKLFLRSILKTEWLIDNEHFGIEGWRNFKFDEDEGELLLKSLRAIRNKPSAEYPTRKPFWFRDTALPVVNVMAWDGESIENVVYDLDDRPDVRFI